MATDRIATSILWTYYFLQRARAPRDPGGPEPLVTPDRPLVTLEARFSRDPGGQSLSWPQTGLSWLPIGLSWPPTGLSWPPTGLSWPTTGLSWPPTGLSWPERGRAFRDPRGGEPLVTREVQRLSWPQRGEPLVTREGQSLSWPERSRASRDSPDRPLVTLEHQSLSWLTTGSSWPPSVPSWPRRIRALHDCRHIVVASACHDIHSGISLPWYCRVRANVKIFYLLLLLLLLLLFSPALCCSSILLLQLVRKLNTTSKIYLRCLPCFCCIALHTGLPFFTNITYSSISNTCLLTTICDLNRLPGVITNKCHSCFVLTFPGRRVSVFLDILLMWCGSW